MGDERSSQSSSRELRRLRREKAKQEQGKKTEGNTSKSEKKNTQTRGKSTRGTKPNVSGINDVAQMFLGAVTGITNGKLEQQTRDTGKTQKR